MLEHFLINDEEQLKLEPGESTYFLMFSNWPADSGWEEKNIKYVASSTLEFNWNQVVE